MKKYISEIDNYDAVIALIEVLEIETENEHIKNLQDKAWRELQEIFKTVTNPEWMIIMLLKARKPSV